MAGTNQVVWTEGLFVRPHHFQHQQRYVEELVRTGLRGIDAYQSGFTSLILDESALGQGKIKIEAATGVMPDGTPFDMPGGDPVPAILSLEDGKVDGETIYFCLPIRTAGVAEYSLPGQRAEAARYVANPLQLRDATLSDGADETIEVGKVQMVLKLGSEDLSSYIRLAAFQIEGRSAEGMLYLNREFCPTSMWVSASPPLRDLADKYAGAIKQRAKNLAERIGQPSQAGVADVQDFMMLLLLNRLGENFSFLAHTKGLHPRMLFRELRLAEAELMTFTGTRLPSELPKYEHDDQTTCFSALTQSIDRALTMPLESKADPIALEQGQFGLFTARVPSGDVVRRSTFVLAVKAAVPTDKLRQEFPAQVKIGSVNRMRSLIALSLPGVRLRDLPVAPRQLPYHAGFIYFEFDRQGEDWQAILDSSSLSIQVSDRFDDLKIQLWAIRD